MYLIVRKVKGKAEILKDSNSTSNKIFHNFSSANTFEKKLNFHTHSHKRWWVKEKPFPFFEENGFLCLK